MPVHPCLLIKQANYGGPDPVRPYPPRPPAGQACHWKPPVDLRRFSLPGNCAAVLQLRPSATAKADDGDMATAVQARDDLPLLRGSCRRTGCGIRARDWAVAGGCGGEIAHADRSARVASGRPGCVRHSSKARTRPVGRFRCHGLRTPLGRSGHQGARPNADRGRTSRPPTVPGSQVMILIAGSRWRSRLCGRHSSSAWLPVPSCSAGPDADRAD